jgi:hypothetical protein
MYKLFWLFMVLLLEPELRLLLSKDWIAWPPYTNGGSIRSN